MKNSEKFQGVCREIADEGTMQRLHELIGSDPEKGSWEFQPVVSFGDSGHGWFWVSFFKKSENAANLPAIAEILGLTTKELEALEVVLIHEGWW